MIYLIGTRHEFQDSSSRSADEISREKFASYLEGAVKEYGVTLIAEEFQESRATVSTIKHVADKLKIRSLFCDPNTEERKNIGIPSRGEIKSALNIIGAVYEGSVEDKQINEEQKKYHPIREKFWLNKIKIYTGEIIIFVCGQDHIVSFNSLLISNGFKTRVLESYL
ncbi:hypothetical protein HZC21_06425 [Candidatus Peregrinibacteria bacterium]|nr:hypothetical protein [Candidatus Peregrinibacteria bacterium]